MMVQNKLIEIVSPNMCRMEREVHNFVSEYYFVSGHHYEKAECELNEVHFCASQINFL